MERLRPQGLSRNSGPELPSCLSLSPPSSLSARTGQGLQETTHQLQPLPSAPESSRDKGLAGAQGSVGGFPSAHQESGSPGRHQLC